MPHAIDNTVNESWRIKTQPGEKPLGVFMREFSDWENWGEMTHSKCGRHHSMDGGTGLNTKYKGSELSSSSLGSLLLTADATRPAAPPSCCHACPLASFTLWDKESLPPLRYFHQIFCYSKEKNNACTPNPTNKPAKLPEPYAKFDQALLVWERTSMTQASFWGLFLSFLTVNGSLHIACPGNRYDRPCKMKRFLFVKNP